MGPVGLKLPPFWKWFNLLDMIPDDLLWPFLKLFGHTLTKSAVAQCTAEHSTSGISVHSSKAIKSCWHPVLPQSWAVLYWDWDDSELRLAYAKLNRGYPQPKGGHLKRWCCSRDAVLIMAVLVARTELRQADYACPPQRHCVSLSKLRAAEPERVLKVWV